MTISVAVVGLGQIGLGYDLDLDADRYCFSHARSFSTHPAYELVGGVDPNPERRSILERIYGAAGYADLGALFASRSPDVLVIATSTASHAALIDESLSRGRPRAILCEKPLAYDVAEARGIVAACASQGVQLFVNYIRRADPGVLEVKRRIDAGQIAIPCKGIAWYSKGFLHNGSHFFDLLTFWLGPMIAAQITSRGRDFGEADCEPDVRVELERAAITFLAAREEDYSHYTVELVAANGRLRYERGGAYIGWQPSTAHPHVQGLRVLAPDVESLPVGMDRYQWHVAEQLAAALDGQVSHLCRGDQALDTLVSMRSITEQR